MLYADLTYEEIRALASQVLAIVPTGCTEQQGPNLPVDFDTWFVSEVTQAASTRAETLGVKSSSYRRSPLVRRQSLVGC